MITRDDTSAGLWVEQTLQPGRAALFALIIGVSDYPHLDGGPAPAQNTFGFGQLTTSALTAFRIFQWLKDAYFFDDVPLARVRLFLAPSADERSMIDDELTPAGHSVDTISLPPTIQNLTDGIQSWLMDMEGANPWATPNCRSLFFFSGHGIQIGGGPLLLPSDWLGPSARVPNDAVSINNIVSGLGRLPIEHQWFFCDACRNDTWRLNELRHLNGRQILNQWIGDEVERNYPIVYASAAGSQAFQPPDPKKACPTSVKRYTMDSAPKARRRLSASRCLVA